jgi:GT2 family glycosyltransferase
VSLSPAVSVLVVSYNTRRDLVACLASLEASPPLDVIVVDNASTDGSPDAVRTDFPQVRLIANTENVGFARANNQALALAHGRFVLVINSDAVLRPGALARLVEHLERHPTTGVVGPRTRGGDGRIQVSFGPALTPLAEWRQGALVRGVRAGDAGALERAEALAAVAHSPGWVSGSCLLARRQALSAVGGFDERFFLYEEDVDLCVRLAQAGWRIDYLPDAEVMHQLGRSMAQASQRARFEYARSHLFYYRKHATPAQTLVLRAWMGLAALLHWLRGDQRALQARVLWLALSGRVT